MFEQWGFGIMPMATSACGRFGSGLQLNVHSHALVLDGVLTDAADGTLRFHPAAAPTDLEVACDGEGDNSANVRDGDVL